MPTYGFDERSIKRIGDAVRAIERMPKNLVPHRASRRNVYAHGGTSLIPARLTAYVNAGSTAKNYTAVGIQPDGSGGWTDISPAVNYTGNVFEFRHFIGIELGARVDLQSAGTWSGSASVLATGTQIYRFVFCEPRVMFAVKVYKTSGAAGPPSTWVYTAKTPDGDVIATGLTPEMRRPSSVATTAPSDGTIGTGYYDASGAFHLLEANESC